MKVTTIPKDIYADSVRGMTITMDMTLQQARELKDVVGRMGSAETTGRWQYSIFDAIKARLEAERAAEKPGVGYGGRSA